jgi:hypothetical protein
MQETAGRCRVTFSYTGEFSCTSFMDMSEYGLVPLHPTHSLDDIYSLTPQYNEISFIYSPHQVEWDFSDYPICIHSAPGCTNHIWHSRRYKC